MSLDVIALVLFGALLHATWNAIIKAGTDKSLDAALVAAGGAVTALPFLAFLPLPASAAWPFIGASAILQFAYFQLVAAAYRAGDIGLVYPLMRGVAPLIIVSTSGLILKESLSGGTLIGTLTICAGILTLAFEARKGGRQSIILALSNAVVIASYTYVDGIGARISGNSISYTLWMSLLPPVLLFAWAISRRGINAVVAHVRYNWWRGLIGGGGSIASYGLALWAMTRAPVATVAALRETSILFALVISVVVLKERSSIWRYVAGTIIAGGYWLLSWPEGEKYVVQDYRIFNILILNMNFSSRKTVPY
ncbi:EamA family transporter [Rhizobium calliandrae]|uniref:EamA family transporter n=1 Tax=Rhizobium calliandrae TaxID=1312182 RepID=UPI003D80AFB2